MRRIPILVGICLIVYAIIGLAWISLPGPQHDEVIFINAAFPASMGTHILAKIGLFGLEIPSMLLSYVGALKGWVWHALFYVWEPSIYSVRIPAVLLGGLALLVFYFWVRRWYPPQTALLVLALAAADPTYIFTARLDWGPVVLTHLLMACGLLLGTKWYQGSSEEPQAATTRPLALLGGAGFCFGLALWDKATFVWFLAALTVSLLLLFPKELFRRLRAVPIVVFSAFLLVGALPLLHYNLAREHPSTASMVRLEPLKAEVMANKIENLRISLLGRSVYGLVGDGADPVFSSRPGFASTTLDFLSSYNSLLGNAFLWLFFATAVLAPFISGHRREVLFPFFIIAFMWIQMIIAKDGGFGVHHYVLAYPFPQLGVAAVLGRIAAFDNRWWRRVIGTIVAIVLLGEISWDARYLRMFRETGGNRFWTGEIYKISEYVQQQKPEVLVILDWGFSNPLLLLAKGRIPVFEDYGGGEASKLAELIETPNVLFLMHAKEFEVFPAGRSRLEEIALRQGATCSSVRDFFQQDGRLVAELVRCHVVSDGASGNPVTIAVK